MDIQENLINLIHLIYAKEMEFTTNLPPAEQKQTGSLEHWSAKDNLAHISAWRRRMAGNLSAVRLGARKQPVEDVDQHNATIYNENKDVPWDSVRAEHSLACKAIIQELERLDAADLLRDDYFYWSGGRTLARLIAGNSVLHPLSHLGAYLAENRRGQLGIEIYQSVMPALSSLDPSQDWQGLVEYDLACVCAVAGNQTRALIVLKEALNKNPSLLEWSRRDPDLVSLHGDPAYQALYPADSIPE